MEMQLDSEPKSSSSAVRGMEGASGPRLDAAGPMRWNSPYSSVIGMEGASGPRFGATGPICLISPYSSVIESPLALEKPGGSSSSSLFIDSDAGGDGGGDGATLATLEGEEWLCNTSSA